MYWSGVLLHPHASCPSLYHVMRWLSKRFVRLELVSLVLDEIGALATSETKRAERSVIRKTGAYMVL